MTHLRVLLEVYIHHRKHHPSTARRDLRIAHPLHPLQIRKRHRPLPRRPVRSHTTIHTRVLGPTRNPGPGQHRRKSDRSSRRSNPQKSSLRHAASLTPQRRLSAPRQDPSKVPPQPIKIFFRKVKILTPQKSPRKTPQLHHKKPSTHHVLPAEKHTPLRISPNTYARVIAPATAPDFFCANSATGNSTATAAPCGLKLNARISPPCSCTIP